MDNLALRVEIVKSFEDHLYLYLQDDWRYYTTFKPFAEKPQGLTQGFHDKASVGTQGAVQ